MKKYRPMYNNGYEDLAAVLLGLMGLFQIIYFMIKSSDPKTDLLTTLVVMDMILNSTYMIAFILVSYGKSQARQLKQKEKSV